MPNGTEPKVVVQYITNQAKPENPGCIALIVEAIVGAILLYIIFGPCC